MEVKNKPIISLGFAQGTSLKISAYCHTALHPDMERAYPLLYFLTNVIVNCCTDNKMSLAKHFENVILFVRYEVKSVIIFKFEKQ